MRAMIKLAMSSGAMLVPAVAFAQQVGESTSIVIDPALARSDVAGARIEPQFAPKPIMIGPIFAEASVSVTGGYDSNVFNRPGGDGAAVALMQPSLSLSSKFAQHELTLRADGALRRFSRFQTENSEEFEIQGKGRFELGRDVTLAARADYAQRIEPRSSAGTRVDAAEPSSYDRLFGELEARVALGKFRLAPSAHYQELKYNPIRLALGGVAAQDFRDARSVGGGVRIEYDFSGLVSGFAEGSYSRIESRSAPALLRRDARDRSIMMGIRGELTPVIHAELAIGYQSRRYDANHRDFGGLTYRADVQWFVTPLVTLQARAGRRFRNGGNRDVAGILVDSTEIAAYYDPLRNLRLSAQATVERDRYRDVTTKAWRTSFRLQAQYRIRPTLSVGSYALLLRQDVSGAPLVNSFTSLSAGIGLTYTP